MENMWHTRTNLHRHFAAHNCAAKCQWRFVLHARRASIHLGSEKETGTQLSASVRSLPPLTVAALNTRKTSTTLQHHYHHE